MEQNALIILLESVLNKGRLTGNNNISFVCPFHISNPPGKYKLEIQLDTNSKNENPWHCWGCNMKGKTIHSLFSKVKVHSNKMAELNLIIQPSNNKPKELKTVELPTEFISLNNYKNQNIDKIALIECKHAIKFLSKRGITAEDIVKYNIGFCKDGPYENRIIIPSYDKDGKLNYFLARDYKDISSKKYKNPPNSSTKDIIGFELYINWNAPIILCEGIFDALTIKRNVIPLFGKVLHEKLMKKLVKSEVDKIYIALDKDAIKDALKYCETLLSYGKKVYLVEMDGKDANEIGFKNFLNIIENTYPLTFQKLLTKKLELI